MCECAVDAQINKYRVTQYFVNIKILCVFDGEASGAVGSV